MAMLCDQQVGRIPQQVFDTLPYNMAFLKSQHTRRKLFEQTLQSCDSLPSAAGADQSI